jgi:hypothetical protein
MKPAGLFRAVVALAFAVSLTAGCTYAPAPASRDEAGVKATVTRYNTLLAAGFAKQDLSQMVEVATPDQAYTEYLQGAAISEMKRRLVSELRGLEVRSVTFSSDDTATVKTTETWDYTQVSTAADSSGTVRMTENGVVYSLVYTVRRLDGRWYVSAVKSVDASGAATTRSRPAPGTR